MFNNFTELSVDKMGLKIMWRLADELSYKRTFDQRNCLSIVKNYESQGLDHSHGNDKSHLSIYLQVKTDPNELTQVLQWVEPLEQLGISKRILCQCKILLAEGFTNAVYHAHKDLQSDTPIELELIVFENHLEMRIWDYGQPFDLEAKLKELDVTVQNSGKLERDGELSLIQLGDRGSDTQTNNQQNGQVFGEPFLTC